MALFSSAWICCTVAVTLMVEEAVSGGIDGIGGKLFAALLTVLVVVGLDIYVDASGSTVLLIFTLLIGLPITIPPEVLFVVFPELLPFAAALIVPADSNW